MTAHPTSVRPVSRARTFGLARMIRQSLLHRRARSLSALLALTVSAAIATALLTLFADLNDKLYHEFRAFGANIVVTEPIPEPNFVAKALWAAGPEANSAAFAYAVASTDRGTPVVVAGVDFAAIRKLDSWWQVAAWPSGPNDALLGQRAANFVADEREVKLTFAGHPMTFHGAGRLKTGGEEDSRIYISLEAFNTLTAGRNIANQNNASQNTEPSPPIPAQPSIRPNVIEIQVPGGPEATSPQAGSRNPRGTNRIDAALASLQAALPQAQVTPVRQLIDGESRIVDRTHALLFAAALLVALTVAVSVLATLSASVLERRRDFALMKALGAREWQMASLFLLETLLLALGGVAAGYLLGSLAAWIIAEANFHTATLPRLAVLPIVLLLNLTIALLASLLPVRSLRSLEPAALLKGE